MKKSKIAIGQCYEKDDVIYEIVEGPTTFHNKGEYWKLRNVLTKELTIDWPRSFILKMRRPFNTEG